MQRVDGGAVPSAGNRGSGAVRLVPIVFVEISERRRWLGIASKGSPLLARLTQDERSPLLLSLALHRRPYVPQPSPASLGGAFLILEPHRAFSPRDVCEPWGG
jgi:hypothetical protein